LTVAAEAKAAAAAEDAEYFFQTGLATAAGDKAARPFLLPRQAKRRLERSPLSLRSVQNEYE